MAAIFFWATMILFAAFGVVFDVYCIFGLASDYGRAEELFSLPLRISFIAVILVFVLLLFITAALRKRFFYGKGALVTATAIRFFSYLSSVLGLFTMINFLLDLRQSSTTLTFTAFNSLVFAIIFALTAVPRTCELIRKKYGTLKYGIILTEDNYENG